MKTKTVVIHVTQKDINKGLTLSCYNCPVALALARKVGVSWMRVGNSVISVDEVGLAPLTRKAKDFIHRFDVLGPKAVKPTTLRLKIPQ